MENVDFQISFSTPRDEFNGEKSSKPSTVSRAKMNDDDENVELLEGNNWSLNWNSFGVACVKLSPTRKASWQHFRKKFLLEQKL